MLQWWVHEDDDEYGDGGDDLEEHGDEFLVVDVAVTVQICLQDQLLCISCGTCSTLDTSGDHS